MKIGDFFQARMEGYIYEAKSEKKSLKWNWKNLRVVRLTGQFDRGGLGDRRAVAACAPCHLSGPNLDRR